ncbi:hypothetical protein [Candidatus Korobacter versatilis]|nr:hypothetical protein [Candidatus Koribacter versatilis]
MPWDVRLEDEQGRPLIPSDVYVEFSMIPEDESLAATKILRIIDRYADTVLNHLQMDDFLREWSQLQPNPMDHIEWELVRRMAEQCKAEPHTYLRFIGD